MKKNQLDTSENNNLYESKVLEQKGYSIKYYTAGDPNNELIVFLHSAFADHRCFDNQIDFFAKKYRVLTIDLLGHGLSSVDNSKDKIDSSADHIHSILKIEGHNKAHFVGVSMGTLIAQYYALQYPNNILSMSLLGGYDINANNKKIAKAQRSANIKMILKAIFSMNSFRRHVSDVSVSNSDSKVKYYEMASLFTRKSFSSMAGMSKILKVRNNVVVTYPLLILCGVQDIQLAKTEGYKWHEREISSHFYMISNAGHCANMDNPTEFNKVLLNFITTGKPTK